jgi:hypothetical protein
MPTPAPCYFDDESKQNRLLLTSLIKTWSSSGIDAQEEKDSRIKAQHSENTVTDILIRGGDRE